MLELTFLLGISVLGTPECSLTTSLASGGGSVGWRRRPAAGGQEAPPRCLCRCWVGAAAAARKGAVSGLYRHRHTNILKKQSKQPAVPGGHQTLSRDKNHLAGAPESRAGDAEYVVSFRNKNRAPGILPPIKDHFFKLLLKVVFCCVCFFWLAQQPQRAEREDFGQLDFTLSCYC